VISEDDKQMVIQFKSYGELQTVTFNKETGRFEEDDWFDLKVL
jgi:hypothetical protein